VHAILQAALGACGTAVSVAHQELGFDWIAIE
jgi:hypothetical protein